MTVNKEISAVVFCGGFGSRMGNLARETGGVQKCLLSVEEKPLLVHIVETLIESFGSARVILAVGYKQEQVIEYFTNKWSHPKVEFEFVPHIPGEEQKKALLSTQDRFQRGEKFLVSPGDVICNSDLFLAITNTLVDEQAIGVLSLASLAEEAPTHNVAKIDEQKRVYGIEFPPPIALDPDHFRDMTIYSFDEKIFDIMKRTPASQLYISPGIANFLKESGGNSGEFLGEVCQKQWWHFVHPEDLTFKRKYE